MAIKIHPEGAEGVYEDNLPRVAGVEVKIRKVERYNDGMGSSGEDRAKEKENRFFLKIYEDELDLKAIRQPFPGNGARNACWYFLTFTK
jgi:hypothetical protein